MWIRPREEEVRARHDEGLAKLEQGDLEGARAIANELRAIGWSGAFELLALAHRAERDLDAALRVLDEGCALAPDAWSLHELRGTLLDTRGEHEAAVAAYDRALRCEGAWEASVRYNRAIAYLRAGDAGSALLDAEAVLSGSTAPPFAVDVVRLAVDALDRLGRREHAVSLVRTALSEVPAGSELGPRLGALLAVALARAGQASAARAEAEAAIEAGEGSAALAALVEPVRFDDRPPRWLRLVVQGRYADRGFLRVISVLAADAEEALRWAASIEPRTSRDALSVDACTDESTAPPPEGLARGVAFASARLAFDES